jgi:glycosyltransferase involved in cell wall biosynthesis
MTAKGVLFDLVAVQSPSYRGRGIARYSFELARVMANRYPELVTAMVVHPELEDAPELGELDRWVTTSPDWDAAGVLHLSSVMEPEVAVGTFWPAQATRYRLLTAVTLYDVIPDLFPGWYLQDPGLRRRWRCCRELVRAADLVFTISHSTGEDAVALLGIPEARVRVIGTGTPPVFRPPTSRQDALQVALEGVDGLEPGFILYNGAFDPRKNVDRLVQGYAALPAEVVRAHQLVIACAAPPLTRNHYLVMARELGVDGRVLITGFVPEEVLVALDQTADLCVFPSLYEGYGMPVTEALACGTPAIAGDNSSLREVLPREARFRPEDPWAIAEAIVRALCDQDHRARLLEMTRRRPPSWDEVADRAAPAFEDLLRQASAHPRAWRRRPHVGLVGVPDHVVAALVGATSHDVHPWPPATPWAFARNAAWQGGYDAVVVMPTALAPAEVELEEALAGIAAAAHGHCLVLTSPETPKRVADAVAQLGLATADAADEGVTGTILDMARRSGR